MIMRRLGYGMNDDEIREMAEQHGFGGESLELAIRLAKEVERETRHNYYRLIQNANNAASARSITPLELDKFVWDTEQSKKAAKSA